MSKEENPADLKHIKSINLLHVIRIIFEKLVAFHIRRHVKKRLFQSGFRRVLITSTIMLKFTDGSPTST